MSGASEEAIAAVPLSYYRPADPKVPEKKDEGSSKETYRGSETYPYQHIWDRSYKQRPNEPSRWDPTYTHKELKIKCRSVLELKRFEEKGILPKNISAKKRKRAEEYLAQRTEEHKKMVEKIVKDAWDTMMQRKDDEASQSIDSAETLPPEVDSEETLPPEVDSEETLPPEVDSEEILPAEVETEETLPAEVDNEETVPADDD
ncbi:hypothetical protein L6164_029369 [Bauhinia variegata]|uniref:Uncharacterized protein n=1 Tax=Bauhinia variegata TaxID=167791 RepID=A0ACB9LAD9_BAUVA|nr:hypothetical protein L6164_029369 [Bauhinia variegata]